MLSVTGFWNGGDARVRSELRRGAGGLKGAVSAAGVCLAGFAAPPQAPERRAEDALYRPTAQMPVFSDVERKAPDVCLDGSCQFASVAAAGRAAVDGDVIVVAPGDYDGCLDTKGKSLAIIGRVGADGARAAFQTPCSGKGAFVASGDAFLLQSVDISAVAVPDLNGACVRLEGSGRIQRAALIDVTCTNSENGVLGTVGQGSLIVRGSRFIANGGNRGQAHGLYVHGGAEVFIDKSTIASSKGQGHSLKVGTPRLIIHTSTIAALNGSNSRAIDFYGGGVLAVRASILQQGKNSDNHDVIALGMEPGRANVGAVQATSIADSWIVYDAPGRCCRWLVRGTTQGVIGVRSTALVGINGSPLDAQLADNVARYASRQAAGLPPYDGTLNSLPTGPYRAP